MLRCCRVSARRRRRRVGVPFCNERLVLEVHSNWPVSKNDEGVCRYSRHCALPA
jgi:hypothetical protein